MSVVASASVLSNRHDFRVVNDFARHTGWLHKPLEVYASYGVVLFALLLLAGWWMARMTGDPRRVGLALLAPVSTLLAVAINQPIVHAVHERRPFVVLPHMLLLVHHSADPGFPSDHATMAGAVTAALWLVSRRLGIVTGVLALLMAFARVYVGAHWPGDVLAGLALGAAVALVLGLVLQRVVAAVVAYLARTPLRPLLLAGRPVTG